MHVRATQEISKDTEVICTHQRFFVIIITLIGMVEALPENEFMCSYLKSLPWKITMNGEQYLLYEHYQLLRSVLQLCLSYINLYEARATRRDQLAATKHFECACTRCTEPLCSSVDRFLEVVFDAFVLDN